MNSIFLRRVLNIAGTAAAAICCFSCISSSYDVGGNLIPTELKYDTYTAEFPLEDIRMAFPDSLSGYSSTRITIGAVRDELFGLTTRGCAISLVPMSDSLDFGKDPQIKNFHFSAARDTNSVADHSQDNILQNINVYELSKPLDFNDGNLNNVVEHSANRITKRTPVYNGTDSLSFDLSAEFAKKYLTITQDDLKDLDTYTKKFPGIYIETDEPVGNGGRINMFTLQLGLDMENYVITGDYATLTFNAEYDGERKDTAFYFWYCPDKMYDLDSLVNTLSSSSSASLPQYCFNVTGHSTRSRAGKAEGRIAVEGGGGLKPVISASEIKTLIENEISKHTDQPREAIINRASIIMPFEFPDDYSLMFRFPAYLNPTVRVRYDSGYVSYGSLTDTSSEYEDPGELNRSLCQYAPDVTYHIQKLLELNNLKKISNYDIWLLLMANEVVRTTISGSSSSSSSYYQQLAYASYYNNLYGGYGGYGYGSSYGYGGYGYGSSDLSNYYYMAMLASAYSSSSSSSSESYTTLMDKDRYYCAILNGPQAERHPTLKIVYSVPCSIAK